MCWVIYFELNTQFWVDNLMILDSWSFTDSPGMNPQVITMMLLQWEIYCWLYLQPMKYMFKEDKILGYFYVWIHISVMKKKKIQLIALPGRMIVWGVFAEEFLGLLLPTSMCECKGIWQRIMVDEVDNKHKQRLAFREYLHRMLKCTVTQ